MKKIKTIVLLLLIGIVSGCSDNVPLGGRVTFSDNGEPLTTGTVVFVDGHQQARGTLDATGYYKLGFVGNKDGIPPGTYKVYISDANEYGPGNAVHERTPIPLIEKKYMNLQSSDLEYAVDKKTKKIDIQVRRAP